MGLARQEVQVYTTQQYKKKGRRSLKLLNIIHLLLHRETDRQTDRQTERENSPERGKASQVRREGGEHIFFISYFNCYLKGSL